MAKKLKRKYNTGGVTQSYSNPLFVQGMQGELSSFGHSSTNPVFAKGGEVPIKEFPIGYIIVLQKRIEDYVKAEKLLNKHGIKIDASKDFHSKGFATEWMSEYNDGRETYIIQFDMFDSPNPKALERDMFAFQNKNPKTAIQWGKYYAKGGEIEIRNSTIDRGGLGAVQDNILANGDVLSDSQMRALNSHSKTAHSQKDADTLVGEYIDIYGQGQKDPISFMKIVKAEINPKYSKKTLVITDEKGAEEFIPEEKINDFFKGQHVVISIPSKGSFYSLKLNRMTNGGSVNPHLFTQDNLLAKGGRTSKRIHIENKNDRFDSEKYQGLLEDYDLDGLANVDDPHPIGKKDDKSVEQVQFADVFNKVLKVKEEKDDELNQFINKLRTSTTANEQIYGRTKTPFSILNKLVDKRLTNTKCGLNDLVGTTVSFNDFDALESYKKKVDNGKLGKIIAYDDFYQNPNDGYRAYHYIIEQNGTPIELQLKTNRMKEINILSHDAYKHKNLNKDYMLYLTSLADRADKGDSNSKEKYSEIMSNKSLVKQELSLNSHLHSKHKH